MARKSPEPDEDTTMVVRGDAVALPRPPRRELPGPPVPRTRLSPKLRPTTHGDRAFGAGAAFAVFVQGKGIDASQRIPDATLRELQQEFQARPIGGHRRTGSGGDNHRVNPEHVRK